MSGKSDVNAHGRSFASIGQDNINCLIVFLREEIHFGNVILASFDRQNIWHKSARMGEILNIFYNFNIFIVLVCWKLSRQRRRWRQSQNFVHTSWPHLDEQVEAFQVGAIPGISKGNRTIADLSISPSTLILDVIKSYLGIYTLHNPPEVLWKLALRWSWKECVRAYFVQLERLSSFILMKWIKYALTHLFELHIRAKFYSTSGGT